MSNINTPPPFDRSLIKRCGTTEYMKRLIQADPSLRGRLDDYESNIQAYIKLKTSTPKPNSTSTKSDSDTLCFNKYQGETITHTYNGVARKWKLYSDANGQFCYKLQPITA